VTTFLQLLFSGISLGFIYALIALGFVIIFKATEVVNFAHGAFLLAGAYVVARLHDRIGFLPALLAGIAVAALVGLLVERLIIRRLRGAPVISLAIVTIGVNILLITELTRRIGTNVFSLGDPWRDHTVKILGIRLAESRVAAIVIGLILIGAFFAAFKYSNWGVAMRATAEDEETALLMGIRLGRVTAVSWVVAGALAAVAGLFLTAFPSPGLDASAAPVALRAFPAAILGGLDSTGGALAGGLIIGVAESLVAGYENNLLFLGRGFGAVVPYVVMILVLLIRPSGLFGTKELTRV
jgi:branched-chain amino acid transport system permease protein